MVPEGVITVRPATLQDLEEIQKIQAVSPGASDWTPEVEHTQVALVGSALAGFIVTRTVAPDEREILNLAVHPERRRQGVARSLLRASLEAFDGAWFLEVRASNAVAVGLYESLGFKAVGRREGYYQEPLEAAIVMRFFS